MITKREVAKHIQPWEHLLDSKTSSYSKAVRELLGEQSKHPEVRLTEGAKSALQILAASPDKLHHYSAMVSGLAWHYGAGIQPVDPPPGWSAGPAIRMDVTMPYADVKPKYKVKIDESKRTVTVFLEGTSKSEFHALVAVGPKPLRIDVKRPSQLGKEYRLIVRDANPDASSKNKILAQTKFTNFLPV